MKRLVIIGWGLSLAGMISCGKITPGKDIKDHKINITPIQELTLEGKFRAFYVPSDSNFISVESPENLFENLSIEHSNAGLRIHEKREVAGAQKTFYTVSIFGKSMPQKIHLKDSVELNTSGTFPFGQLNLKQEGRSKSILSAEGENLHIHLSQNSSANFRGYAAKAFIKIQDSTGLVSPYLIADEAAIEAKGPGYVEMSVKKIISGNIGPGAKLTYYGDPVRKLKIDPNAKVINKKEVQ